jgi:hypothetical protein
VIYLFLLVLINLLIFLLLLISDFVLVSCDTMSSRKYPSESEKRKRKNELTIS